MRISDWSSDVCSSDLSPGGYCAAARGGRRSGRETPQFVGKFKLHVFLNAVEFFDRDVGQLAETRDQLLHQSFGRRRASGDADSLGSRKPGWIELAGVVDQIAGNFQFRSDFTQTVDRKSDV